MPRRLHPDGVPEFLTCFAVGDRCESCQSDNLNVTVWDDYGAAPEDGSPEAEKGTGTFVAAVVVCEACAHSLTLDRARLAGSRAAE